ncbi:MAG: molybdenum cofactor guanylyltransferase [Planctomycetota bacterium]|nr:molybdenum cofactor guanylyltransferase [Planctomycetota bacterium]
MSPKLPVKQENELSIGAIVLCGGKSRRMGSSKAWLQFGKERLLQRITQKLAAVVKNIVVVASPHQELPVLNEKIEVLRDEFPDQGPLSGMYSGLKRLAEQQVHFAYVTACDCPFLKTEFIQFLIDQLDNKTQIVLIDDGNFKHVLSAIYSTTAHLTARQLMEQGKFRPLALTESHSTKLIAVDEMRCVDAELQSLINLNSPSDYEAALTRFNNPC